MSLPRNSAVRSLTLRLGYPAALLAAIGLWALGTEAGLSTRAATLLGVLTVGVALLVAERLVPFTTRWHAPARSFALDSLHSAVTSLAVAPLVHATAFVLVVDASARLSGALGGSPWPRDLPLAAQLVLALLVADFGAYWAHRLMHLHRLGWRIHVVHHCTERLNVMASARSHPFNALLTHACETGSLLLLGIGPEALAAWTVFKAVNGLLQHSNIDLLPGWLSYVVATSDVHRHHHSVDIAVSNTNFGNTTMVWDHLFRTFHLPPDERPGEDVGVADAAIPESYLAHLVAPFALARYERAARAAASPEPRG